MFTQPSPHALLSRFSTPLITPVLPLLTGLLLAGLALGHAETARAQAEMAVEPAEAALEAVASRPADAVGITNPAWRAHFGEQAVQTLRGGSPDSRAEMLRNLIVVANLDQNEIDLSPAVPRLATIVETSANENHRVMALHALGAIGTDHASEVTYRRAVERLVQQIETEPPGLLRHVAIKIVERFYEDHGEPMR